MNSRKLIALFMVLALTGSALAAQQQRMFHYKGTDDRDDLKAAGVTAVQQHSIFIEIVIEKQDKEEEIHEFAAVVGLIKECKQVRNVFDNAVLWFNDQFLFGTKEKDQQKNKSNGDTIGENPNVTIDIDDNGDLIDDVDPDGFVGTKGDNAANGDGTPRWGGCFIPDGFAHAIGGDDPFGTVSASGTNVGLGMDAVKDLIGLDHDCNGCIFEYHSTFFVVDPNDHRWIVDKYFYPVTLPQNDDLGTQGGNAFTGGCGGADNSDTGMEDPRQFHDQTHANTCEDDGTEDDENHCYDPDDTNGECENQDKSDPQGSEPLLEPLFTTHLQTDPVTNMGFADRATFQFDDSGTDSSASYNDEDGDGVADRLREGAIYPTKNSPNREKCETNPEAEECAVEYNFLLAVDFAAFDETGLDAQVASVSENEITRGCAVNHNDNDAGENDEEWWQGQSHTHSGDEEPFGPDSYHCHPTVNLDIFYDDQAPYFTEQNKYWEDDYGQPVDWDATCSSTILSGQDDGTEQDPTAVENRNPIVCDSDGQGAPYHQHPDQVIER